MLPKTHISDDVFLHIPPSLSTPRSESTPPAQDGDGESAGEGGKRPKPRRVLVFFITGNPGLIGYYHPFLSLIVEGLGDSGKGDDGGMSAAVAVAGLSLGGFDVEREKKNGRRTESPADRKAEEDLEDSEVRELLYPPSFEPLDPDGDGGDGADKVYSLREQIELNYARVEHLVRKLTTGFGDGGDGEKTSSSKKPSRGEVGEQRTDEDNTVEVILMGHSVGTYIALELVRLWHERNSSTSSPSPPNPHPWTISACILLTPTVVDLHVSPSGRIATPLLSSVPFLPTLAHGFLHGILLPTLPSAWFSWLVSRVSGMQGGSHGFETTMAFLRSRKGVRQALYLARWELSEIRADRWGEEVWGASEAFEHDELEEQEQGKKKMKMVRSPQLYLWFAKDDHWVADMTREEISKGKARGVVERNHVLEGRVAGDEVPARQEENAPAIRILETDGLAHAWCLAQSEFVARRVGAWIGEALR